MAFDFDDQPVGTLDRGVNVRAPRLSREFSLDFATKNLTSGLNQGLGPRYGMAPIPGHSDNEAPAVLYEPAGLMRSENVGGNQPNTSRLKVFGVHGIVIGKIGAYATKQKCYLWILANIDGTVDVAIGSTRTSAAPRWGHEADIAAGLCPTLGGRISVTATLGTQVLFAHLPLGTLGFAGYIFPTFTFGTAVNSMRSALFSVSGAQIPCKWIVGTKLSDGTANQPAGANYTSNAGYTGLPSMFNTRNIRVSTKMMEFFDLNTADGLMYHYRFTVNSKTDNIYTASFYQDPTVPNINLTNLGNATARVARLDAAAPALNTSTYQLLFDPDCVNDSSHIALCVATGGAPLIVIVQDWQLATDGLPQQWIDPTLGGYDPCTRRTIGIAGAFYTENAVQKGTCWNAWPEFVDGTATVAHTAAVQTGTIHVTLGAADSGILRSYTAYEFSFAVFDKQLGFETNVGEPAKIMTGPDDFVRVSLYRDPTVGGVVGATPLQRGPYQFPNATPFPPRTAVFNSQAVPFANYLEFRVYYRELGATEWLPALSLDAAKAYYYPNFNVLWACEGAIAGLPGGQPGGFNDYSALPKGTYIDTVVFQDRVFWCSTKSLYWSYRKNVFAYAGRNSAACPTGEWRGLLVHVYPGQREKDAVSRMLVFASDAIYTGRFTGQPFTQPVQISPDSAEAYPLDGSDFIIEFWTSFTAFSSRAAIVAEGKAYWWGPKGFFADLGTGAAERISSVLEPDVNTLYDPNKTDEIHAVYSDQTKEITWFYPAKGGATNRTAALVFNTESQNFVPGEFYGKVDAAQQLQIDKANTSRATNGQRTLVFSRESSATTLQRAYFFDYRNKAGDIYPKGEMMVKTVASPATGQRRLTLAAGFDATNFATIAAGDGIAVHQAVDYGGVTAASDMLAKVLATNVGAGTIDILLPTGATMDAAASPTEKLYFPVWHAAAAAGTRGINGIDYELLSNYWCPGGLSYAASWPYAHWLFFVNLFLRNVNLPTRFSHRTPISGGFLYYDVNMRDNSDGNYQLFLPLQSDEQGFEGQGLKFRLTGVHLGGQWVLQSLHGKAVRNIGADWPLHFHPENG